MADMFSKGSFQQGCDGYGFARAGSRQGEGSVSNEEEDPLVARRRKERLVQTLGSNTI